ncbi:MAG TPA: M12 family metallo-peptidase [Thermoanaerobaculia bacterium]|nr:M12 family metallo-peptidase [Thermoanaerobaculia bacterium]
MIAGLAVGAGTIPAGAAVRSLAAADLGASAPSVAVGEMVRIDGFGRGERARQEVFVGRRFEVFSPDARIVVVGEQGERLLPVPANVYFAGAFDGVPGSRVLLSVLEGKDVRGIAVEAAGPSLILPSGQGRAPEIRRVDVDLPGRSFRCDQSQLGGFERALLARPETPSVGVAEAPSGVPPTHTARVAVDTDFEYYQLFNDEQVATNYTADLIAYMSILYEDQIDTSMQLSFLRLWTTAADPWTQTSTICNLFQFGKHWNDAASPPTRTIFHMMSGKNNGGGVAWVGVLCNGPFSVNTSGAGCTFSNTANYGGDYGYTGTMDGDFSYEDPGVLWDILATSHEIGHNFNSPHTHCYNGVGGNANPVDACYNGECPDGCYCGATSLPGPGALTGGTPGAGNGTIMSYCHLRSGGYGNITYTFGVGHPFGIAPGRVPTRMANEVATVAAGNPGCLSFVPGTSVIFRDGVDQGSTANWSVVVP